MPDFTERVMLMDAITYLARLGDADGDALCASRVRDGLFRDGHQRGFDASDRVADLDPEP
jgi:hypothetical protein